MTAKRAPIAVSTGCPSGIGPEVALAAAARVKHALVLIGDFGTLVDAARVVGVDERRLEPFVEAVPRGKIGVYHVGPSLSARERRPGRPSRAGGRAQLAYVEAGYRLCAQGITRALVTAPVSKEAIVRAGAAGFRGHTEWLARLDRARGAVMCFVAENAFATSLVTTHLPLAAVPRAIDASGVADATRALGELLRGLGVARPRIAVASLNPHAGEGELFGNEERRAIVPGIRRAARALAGKARIEGPIGAETAFRRAAAGALDGVVAMYHDQATIPMKLVAFGDAVNVTMGLSIVRTSVDHGTAYDIARRGIADARGMIAAIELGARLAR